MIGGSPIGGSPISANSLPTRNSTMLRFFQELDTALLPFANGQRLDLYHLGRSALVWRYQAKVSTKDIDIVQMRTPLEEKAYELFGRESEKAKELDLYLDLVSEALPPLPSWFRSRSTEVEGNWQVIRLWELEPHDLAATKLKAFRPKDRDDLRFMCDNGLLREDNLRQSLEKAWLWSTPKDGDPLYDATFANLYIVIAYLKGQSLTL